MNDLTLIPLRTRASWLWAVLLPTTLMMACGSSGGDNVDDTSDDDDDNVSIRVDAAPNGQLDPADCMAVGESFVQGGKACGEQLPGNAATILGGFCRDGIADAELCGGDAAAGMECFIDYNANDWECFDGIAVPYCDGDTEAALGMVCLIALGNPNCASLACSFNSDCPSGANCNGKTGQCFAEDAYCIGLPCTFNSDCPTGETCNGAEGACVSE